MSRRIHDTARGFAEAAPAYARGRPSYPDAAIAALSRGLGLTAGDRVADLGAGTGALTRLLVQRGMQVTAVEPVAAMRAALTGTAGVLPVDATAESTGLPAAGVCAAVAGQAWHWFQGPAVLTEAARITAADGGLGTVRNEMDLSVPWVAALRQIRQVAEPAGYPSYDRRTLLADIEAAPGWGEPVIRSFPYVHETTHAGVVDRILSTSYIAALPSGDRERIAARVHAVIADLRTDIAFPYLTEVVTVRRS